MRLHPFRALRYDASVAGPPEETSAPPYDIVDPLQYRQHRTTNPYTVLELQTGSEEDDADAFDGARSTLSRWRRTGVLVEDVDPSVYVYEQHEVRHGAQTVQRGIIATVDLTELDEGTLLLHEQVDEARAALRARRMSQVPVDLTPVVALHMAGEPVDLDHTRTETPMAAFTDRAGIDHRLWRITDPTTIQDLVRANQDVTAVLADGHHRVAAARRLAAQPDRPPGWGRLTVWLVDATAHGPELRAVHRLVPGRPPTSSDGTPLIDGFRAQAWHDGVAHLERAVAEMPGLAVGLVTAAGVWVLQAEDPWRLRRAAAPGNPTLQRLDAQVVATAVLPAIAPEGDVQAVMDVADGAAQLARSETATLVVLAPPTAGQVFDVAAAGLRMPAKTTRFRPKPRAGLVMRRLDGPS